MKPTCDTMGCNKEATVIVYEHDDEEDFFYFSCDEHNYGDEYEKL
jgi:hypothetical protein